MDVYDHQTLPTAQTLLLSLAVYPYRSLLFLSPVLSIYCRTELMNVSFCWFINSDVSMCGSPPENIVHGFVLTSSAVLRMFYLDDFKLAIQQPFCLVLLYSKQQVASLCNSHLVFFSKRFISPSGTTMQLYRNGHKLDGFLFAIHPAIRFPHIYIYTVVNIVFVIVP